ncbi:MAG: hypothetical protein H0Z34_15135 [Brevibacillus sp.]|nr:hypothetical protein [Brevibacillus sp.]
MINEVLSDEQVGKDRNVHYSSRMPFFTEAARRLQIDRLLPKMAEMETQYREDRQAAIEKLQFYSEMGLDRLTREEFALFVAQHLDLQIDGKTIYDLAGVVPGPTGTVEKVAGRMPTMRAAPIQSMPKQGSPLFRC